MWNHHLLIPLCILIFIPLKICTLHKVQKAINKRSSVVKKQVEYGEDCKFVGSHSETENTYIGDEVNQDIDRKSAFNWRKLAEYENSHRSMFATAAEYETWPELTSEIQMYLCIKFIQKLFKKNTKSVVTTLDTLIWMKYLKNPKLCERVMVAALRCEISPPADGRKFIFFIRSPRDNCLYLINHQWDVNSEEFYITEQICEFGVYNYWLIYRSRKYESNRKYQRKRKSKSDRADFRKMYEMNHLKDYSLHTDEYVNWSKFRKANAEELCKNLLNVIFPRTNFQKMDATDEEVKLYYEEIQKTEEARVGAVKCQLPEKERDNIFRFIKAPVPNCVYWVKCKNSKTLKFHIVKLFCKNDDIFYIMDPQDLHNISEIQERQHKDERMVRQQEIEKEHKYGDKKKVEWDYYNSNYTSIINKPFYNFI